jgi:uncharacterized phage-like protein YoqJ
MNGIESLSLNTFRLGVTGHRPEKLGGYDDFTNRRGGIVLRMRYFFTEKGVTTLVSGMALGTDQWAAELALDMGIKVVALIPCLNQEKMWPDQSRARYRELLDRIKNAGGQVTYVSLQEYWKGCMHRRNFEIVSSSDEILAVWDGAKGGTSDCVKIAYQEDLPVTVLNPHTLDFERREPITYE